MDPNKPPQIEGRYLNLKRVATGETDKDVPKMKLVGRNGLKFKIRGDTYSVEQDIIGGANPTLVKAGLVWSHQHIIRLFYSIKLCTNILEYVQILINL